MQNTKNSVHRMKWRNNSLKMNLKLVKKTFRF
jgi:hypothetical protein